MAQSVVEHAFARTNFLVSFGNAEAYGKFRNWLGQIWKGIKGCFQCNIQPVTGIICQPEKDLGICHQTNALISVSAKAVIKTRSKSFSPGSGLCHTLPDFRSRSRCLVHPDIGLISDPVVGWPSITLSTCSSAGAWSVEWWQCSCNPVQLCK